MLIFLLLLLLVNPGSAPPAAAHEVAISEIFNTGPFPCNGSPVVQEWTNQGPWTMYLYSARIFHGRDYGVIADYHTEVKKYNSSGSIVALFQNDAYDMGGHREQETNYAGHYQVLLPGEKLYLFTYCSQFFATGGNGHTVVEFTWAGTPE